MPRELISLSLDEVSVVDEPANPGARIALMKRAAPEHEEKNMRINDAIAKAMAPDPTDTPKDAERKALMKAQLDAGTASAEALGWSATDERIHL